ncbi:MAG: tRNA uridine-5-carboxymethylaminomethyl(34) synthesis enzyme MnmG, partial [Mangrovicoccus sp.]|nr:tRNA uridine-5-carboxymethylaminomethyl(34) synthesis enzyme MnmG [Mangrovicoccus sp.]
QLGCDALYAQYMDRQSRDAEALKRQEHQIIPSDFDFRALKGLSNEIVAKFEAHRPGSLAQAAKIEGMTPAALTVVLAALRQLEKRKHG